MGKEELYLMPLHDFKNNIKAQQKGQKNKTLFQSLVFRNEYASYNILIGQLQLLVSTSVRFYKGFSYVISLQLLFLVLIYICRILITFLELSKN